MKALVVSLSIPFIGRPHFPEIRNIPSIGYEGTKACKGSSLAWNIPFMGTARFGESTSNVHRFAKRDYVKDSLPAAYTPFIGVRRGRKCLASGPRGEVRL